MDALKYKIGVLKSISLVRKKKKKFIVLLRKETMNKLVVDLLHQKGSGC